MFLNNVLFMSAKILIQGEMQCILCLRKFPQETDLGVPGEG